MVPRKRSLGKFQRDTIPVEFTGKREEYISVDVDKKLGINKGLSRREFIQMGAAGAGLLLLGGCGTGGGSGSSQNKTLDLGYIEWDENVANSNVIKQLAEKDLGYKQVNLKLADVGPVFQSVATGDTMAFLDAWMPNHRQYLDKVGNGAILADKPWYLGQTEYGIAVPDYMSDVKSVADLNNSGAKAITGIEPGALLMGRIQDKVIPAYNLDLKLVGSSTPAMLAALQKAYNKKEPFVFLAWSPHWMNARYDFHYLKDPKNAMGTIDDPAKLYAVVNKDLKSKDPVAFALIDSMRFTKAQMDKLELEIQKADSPEKGVSTWIKNNRDVVKPWVDAAKKAQN